MCPRRHVRACRARTAACDAVGIGAREDEEPGCAISQPERLELCVRETTFACFVVHDELTARRFVEPTRGIEDALIGFECRGATERYDRPRQVEQILL